MVEARPAALAVGALALVAAAVTVSRRRAAQRAYRAVPGYEPV